MSDTVRVKPPIKDADPQWTIVWSALSWFVSSNVVTDSDSDHIHRIVAHLPLISSFLSPNQFLFRVGYLSMSGWWFPQIFGLSWFEFWVLVYDLCFILIGCTRENPTWNPNMAISRFGKRHVWCLQVIFDGNTQVSLVKSHFCRLAPQFYFCIPLVSSLNRSFSLQNIWVSYGFLVSAEFLASNPKSCRLNSYIYIYI